MAESKIKLVITATTKGLQSGMKRAGGAIKTFKNAIRIAASALSGMRTGFIAAAAAVGAMILISKKLIGVWLKEEKSNRDLNASLKSHGIAIKEARKEIDAFADAQQATTRFGDTDTRKTIQTLIDMNLDLASAMKVAGLSMDTSIATGKDLAAVTEAIGKAFGGQSGALSRYGIIIDQAKFKTEGFNAVVEALEVFQGRAAAEMDTMTAKLIQLSNFAGDAQEALGFGLTNALIILSEEMFNADSAVTSMGKAVQKLTEFVLTKFGPALVISGRAVIAWGKFLLASAKPAFDALSEGIAILEDPRRLFSLKNYAAFQKKILAGYRDIGDLEIEAIKLTSKIFDAEEFKKLSERFKADYAELLEEASIAAGKKAGNTLADNINKGLKETEIIITDIERTDIGAQIQAEMEELKRQDEEHVSKLREIASSELKLLELRAKPGTIEFMREEKRVIDALVNDLRAANLTDAAIADELVRSKNIADQIRDLQIKAGEEAIKQTASAWRQFLTGLAEKAKEVAAPTIKRRKERGETAKAIEAANKKATAAEKELFLRAKIAETLGEEVNITQGLINIISTQIKDLAGKGVSLKELGEKLKQLAKKREEEDIAKKTKDDAIKATEAAAAETKAAVQDAVEVGLTEGARAGAKRLGDIIYDKLKKRAAEAITESLIGGGTGLAAFLGGGGAGAGATAAAGAGAAGGGAAAGAGAGAGAGGDGFLGDGLSIFGGGIGGLIGGGMAISMLAGMFKKGGMKAALSGVDPLFGGGPNISTTSDILGGDAMERAAFSSRNVGGALTNEVRARRAGLEVVVKVDSGPEFDMAVTTRWVSRSVMDGMGGIPKRTAFENA